MPLLEWEWDRWANLLVTVRVQAERGVVSRRGLIGVHARYLYRCAASGSAWARAEIARIGRAAPLVGARRYVVGVCEACGTKNRVDGTKLLAELCRPVCGRCGGAVRTDR